MPLVADFLRKKKPEVIAETGDRLEKHAYALVVENGYNKHDRFPVLDAAWPTVAAALPRFLAGPNDRLQTVCNALNQFLNFTGRWDEWLALSRDAESRAVVAKGFLQRWLAGLSSRLGSLSARAISGSASLRRPRRGSLAEAQAGARERAILSSLRGNGHQSSRRLLRRYRSPIAKPWSFGVLWTRERGCRLGLNDLADAERYLVTLMPPSATTRGPADRPSR